jgi:hypothetical protein
VPVGLDEDGAHRRSALRYALAVGDPMDVWEKVVIRDAVAIRGVGPGPDLVP